MDGYWIIHTCFHSIFITNSLVLYHWCKKKRKIKTKIISQRLNRLVSKINEKMGAQALLSRSHLNISFRNIDLFCVTYPGPFFVIKREGGTVAWGPSQSHGYPSWWMCASGHTCVCVSS